MVEWADRWDRRHRELAGVLARLPGRGGGLVVVGQLGVAHAVLCHVGRLLAIAEATGDWSTRPEPHPERGGVVEVRGAKESGAPPADLERLVRWGWLPPDEDSPRWVKRWLLEETAWPVLAAEVLTVVRGVHRAEPDRLVVRAGPCDQPACVVHSAWSSADWGRRAG